MKHPITRVYVPPKSVQEELELCIKKWQEIHDTFDDRDALLKARHLQKKMEDLVETGGAVMPEIQLNVYSIQGTYFSIAVKQK